jgi:hypothetical protein
MIRSIDKLTRFDANIRLTGHFSNTSLTSLAGLPDAFIAAGNPLCRHGGSAKQGQQT